MALYRKYRPQTWDEVTGQDHIVSVLKNEIALGKVAHAYLFSGSRGTGKTSIARIFSRELETTPHDLYEIDAASNTGVDDIRALSEAIYTLPFDSKYKVYILDEAHMLSKSAWNAFLKTLEEPPAYVIFILATTEIEKVPDTVASRCQTFVFKKPTRVMLKDYVGTIAKAEKRKVDPAATELLALLGDGSFRDTAGTLEKVLSSTKNEITREEVELVTGAPKGELVNRILESVVRQDLATGMKALETANESGADMKFFAKLILERLRLLFLLRLKAGMESYIKKEVSEDDFLFLSDLAQKAGKSLTAETLLAFIEAYETSGSAIPQLSLELALNKVIGEK